MTKAPVHPMDRAFYWRAFGVLMIGALVGAIVAHFSADILLHVLATPLPS